MCKFKYKSPSSLAVILALFFGFAGLLAPGYGHPLEAPKSANEKALAAEVVQFRQQLKEAIEKKDAKLLTRLYADDFTHTHTSGKTDAKDKRIVSALAGEPVVEAAVMQEPSVRAYEPATVVISAVSPIMSMAEKKEIKVIWLQVFVKRPDGWRLAASQATRVP